MNGTKRYRDSLRRYVPPWLSERVSAGATAGFRTLQGMVAPLDDLTDRLVQGVQAAWPGKGTPTALALIGRARGLIRGMSESDDDYAARLRGWLTRWRIAGSQEAIARAFHEYAAGSPKVRVVNRAGEWTTIDTDGSLSRAFATWNWDGISSPEWSGYWSELWVIVYTPPWSISGPTLISPGAVLGGRTTGLGHLCTRENVDALHGLMAQWKSAHSFVRAVIWTYNAALFDPAVPASLPNGKWGQWSGESVPGVRTRSDRSIDCRYWEPVS